MKLSRLISTIVLLIALPASSLGATCEDYPEFEGVRTEVVDEAGNIKILSTESVAVPINDRSVINNARKRAILKAKGAIVSYLEDDVSTSCETDDLTTENIKLTKSDEVESKNVDITFANRTLCNISSKGRELIRGAVQVGYCYTPSDVVIVTMGIKPETIRGANNLRNNMKNNSSSTPGSAGSSGGSNKNEGFSRFNSDF